MRSDGFASARGHRGLRGLRAAAALRSLPIALLAALAVGCGSVADEDVPAPSDRTSAASMEERSRTSARRDGEGSAGPGLGEGSSSRARAEAGDLAGAASMDRTRSSDETDGTRGDTEMSSSPTPDEKIELTDAEWRERLNAEEYRVLRQKGTERAFTGDLWDEKDEGTYVCAGCGLPLFASGTKFESGTGWPSFWAPIERRNVAEEADDSFFTRRTEVLCARCGGHLGHVFEDGPAPTYQRYCINSAALDFEKKSSRDDAPSSGD